MPLIVNGTEIEHVILKAPGINQEIDELYVNSTQVFVSTVFVAKPTLSGSFTFDNSAKSPTVTGYDSAAMTKTGTESATAAGTYTITYSLKKGYAWTDGTTEDVTLTWTIAKRSITIPSISNTSKTYNAASQSPTIANVDPTYVTQSGTASATSAGSYTVTWALVYPDSTTWSDGTTANKTGSWNIGKMSITVPSLSGTTSFSFIEGTTRTVSVSNFNSTYMTQSGTVSASALGTYTVTWALKDTANTQWSGGTTTDKSASWYIVWTNGTSHYSNDIYNRGWYSSGALEFTDYASSGSKKVNWNTDNLEIQYCKLRTAAANTGKTIHFSIKVNVYSGSMTLPTDVVIRSFNSSWGSTTLGTGSVGSSYTEISAATGSTSSKYPGLYNGNNPSASGLAAYYTYQIQRIWLT